MVLALSFTSTLFLLLHVAASSSASSPPPPPQGCTDELVSLSPCIGYISAPPDNVTDTAGPQCCDAFSKALESGITNCLCYLIREPLILGFPLNLSRVATLPSACSSNASLAIDPLPLDLVCSGAPTLPPLHGISGSVIPKPFNSGPHIFRHPLPDSPPLPESANTLVPPLGWPSVATSPPAPAGNTSSSKQISNGNNRWLLAGVLTYTAMFC